MTEVDSRPSARVALPEARRRPPEAVRRLRSAEQGVEAPRHVRQRDPVLRPFRASQRGNDRRQVEMHAPRIVDVARKRNAEQPLCAEIGFKQHALLFAAPTAAQVADGFVVDREKAHRRAVLRCHVGERRAVGHRQRSRALAEILDEGAHHLFAPQQFGHRQHQIGRRHAFAQAAAEFDADDVRSQEVDRLSEHRRLGLDAADAPADDADGIDHRGV